jgi:hypothetical protein
VDPGALVRRPPTSGTFGSFVQKPRPDSRKAPRHQHFGRQVPLCAPSISPDG